MRRLVSLGLVLVALTGAWAKPKPKLVTVTNFPATQAVQVQNSPLAPSKPSQVVALVQSGSACPYGGFAIDQQATGTDFVNFAIPAGQVLVVTGFEWSVDPATPGVRVEALLQTQRQNTATSDWATSTTTAGSDGKASKNELTPLIVLKPAYGQICMSVVGGSFNAGTVHGFLAPDE